MTLIDDAPALSVPDQDRLAGLLEREPRLAERHPALYPLAVRLHRARRRVGWLLADTSWARTREDVDLPVRVRRHKSLLLRQLGESEMYLQHNKVTNLRLAAACVDGLLIRPGETFSFNQAVGNCTRRRGFVEGMRLSNGEARPGVGGGICQLANLIHWMALHSGLTVTERSEHSFDPFPDNGRVLPWGTGCSIVYNYVDLQLRNDTMSTFQLRVSVGERYLDGDLRVSEEQPTSYRVYAANERFYRLRGDHFRANQMAHRDRPADREPARRAAAAGQLRTGEVRADRSRDRRPGCGSGHARRDDRGPGELKPWTRFGADERLRYRLPSAFGNESLLARPDAVLQPWGMG